MKPSFKQELLERIQQQIDTHVGMSATNAFAEISHESTDRECSEAGEDLMLSLRDLRRLENAIRSDRFPGGKGELAALLIIIEMMFHDSVG